MSLTCAGYIFTKTRHAKIIQMKTKHMNANISLFKCVL